MDMNADGLDDLLCIAPSGDLYLATNNGDGHGNVPPTFTSHGLGKYFHYFLRLGLVILHLGLPQPLKDCESSLLLKQC